MTNFQPGYLGLPTFPMWSSTQMSARVTATHDTQQQRAVMQTQA